MARSYRLVLEYDGTDFEGWQVQSGGRRTVQGALESAIARVTGQTVRIMGSGRTDAGVHAEGQVASVSLEGDLDPTELRRSLNGVLPRDIGVREVARAPDGFNARRDAVAKRYRYALWTSETRSPLRARQSLHVPHELDLAAMRAACERILGVHDFASFQAARAAVKTTTRELLAVEIKGPVGGEIHLEFEGSGFLRHMVRNLVGTLLEVAQGRRTPEGLSELLEARDRRQAGPTAPAHGLTLLFVRYPDVVYAAAGTP